MLVQDFLHHSAERWPAKVALVADGRRLTYSQIDEMANRLANLLIAAGVKRGDRVAIYLPNCTEAAVGIFAILKAGGVFVVVNASTKSEKLAFILKNAQAVALIADEGAAMELGERLFTEVKFLRALVSCGNTPA